jgi:hypothetical protein
VVYRRSGQKIVTAPNFILRGIVSDFLVPLAREDFSMATDKLEREQTILRFHKS